MSKSSFERGVEAGQKGEKPDLPKAENDISDHIFFTTVSKEDREKEREEYKRGYEAGSNQKSKKG